jgi:SPP1 family predicted phage head-tail adaptor
MGGFTDSYVTRVTVWAAIWPTSAQERIESMANTLTVSHRIKIRYLPRVSSSWRVKFGSRYFAIVSVINPNEKNEWLDMLCKESVS